LGALIRDPFQMQGVDMFCERCGTRQPSPPPEPNSPGVLARRFLETVGLTTADGVRQPTDLYLRLCLGCREYSCPICWNDEVGLCQTCAPLPQPAVVWVAPQPEPEPEPVVVVEPEPEPEPVVVAEPEPEPEPVRPALPRMPILPLPRPRQPETELPLPPIFDYPVAPQIHFERQHVTHAVQPEYPSYAQLARPTLHTTITPTGVRPCQSCQLSLSAKARFCRRCGTAQAA